MWLCRELPLAGFFLGSFQKPSVPAEYRLLLLPAVGDNAAMQNEQPKSKRRWLQFSLRTLLIGVTLVAIPCGYVGWQAKIVRERATVFDWLRERAPLESVPKVTPGYYAGQDANGRWSVGFYDVDLPWLRGLLGDHWISEIVHPTDAPASDIQRVKAAFPEASVISWTEKLSYW
jgi:hypothetical protein